MNGIFEKYYQIIKEELVPALGCTEPIAIAFAASKATEVLNQKVDKILVQSSGNIIKNVKSVTVPNSGGLTGVETSAILGCIGGQSKLGLEVLSKVTPAHIDSVHKLLASKDFCKVELLDTEINLHIILTVFSQNSYVTVEIQDFHTNVVYIEKDKKVLLDERGKANQSSVTDRSILNFDAIYQFCKFEDLSPITDLLNKQINYNMAIATEGLTGRYGINIGGNMLENNCDSIFTKMKANAAAASEARMSGCTLPVVTNSGSGNQGIATSVPLIVYAKEHNYTLEQLHRALAFANLLTIYQKTPIGRLSAFCGAVSATCSSMSAVGFIQDLNIDILKNIVINTLATDIGMVCDGAKASCAAKIACGLDCSINSYNLAKKGYCYSAGDGIVKCDVDCTILAVGRMAAKGMKSTDKEILTIMLED